MCDHISYFMQVKEAILGMTKGDCALNAEDIAGLLKCLPSADERDMLQRHAARYAELGMAEQFMLSMMSISQVYLSLLPVATPAHCMQEVASCLAFSGHWWLSFPSLVKSVAWPGRMG